jgi:hypothetical protein
VHPRTKQINHTLRRVLIEEQLEVPVSFRGGGCTARKKILLIRVERSFNVAGVGDYGALDQQTSQVGVAGLRDTELSVPIPGLTTARAEAEIAPDIASA